MTVEGQLQSSSGYWRRTVIRQPGPVMQRLNYVRQQKLLDYIYKLNNMSLLLLQGHGLDLIVLWVRFSSCLVYLCGI